MLVLFLELMAGLNDSNNGAGNGEVGGEADESEFVVWNDATDG